MQFFQGFTLDTLLGGISCILGVIALIIGGKAYKECKIIKAAANDKKEFKDSSSDHSQRAAGDIINNNCDVNALTTITSANFSENLQMAINHFEEMSKNNLQQIVGETQRIILENKVDYSQYSKTDWINFYLECAKNTSDQYMQSVWARVFAYELSKPDSFSFLTLNTLRNIPVLEFKQFVQLARLRSGGTILCSDILKRRGFSWSTLQHLKEHGLISLDDTDIIITVKAKSKELEFIGISHLLTFKNDSESEVTIKVKCYPLTSAAMELIHIVDEGADDETAIEIAKEYLKGQSDSNLHVFLYRLNIDDPNKITYYDKNLLDL